MIAHDWSQALGTAVHVVIILVIGFLLRFAIHKVIDRITGRIEKGLPTRLVGGRATALLESSPLMSERRTQRARSIGSVTKSVTTLVLGVMIALYVLDALGQPIGPLLASAGIVGVALGFGAQTLVRDLLSGIFMIAEDQYGVGDVVDAGPASGSVESVGLRVTRIRDVNGTVWYVRNGEIQRVGNMSQGWARAVIDVSVGYGEDVSRVISLLLDVAKNLRADPAWTHLVIEDPEVWGVESLSTDSLVVRLVSKTPPLQQWAVARELRRRIKESFDANAVQLPIAQRTVWLREEGSDAGGVTRRDLRPEAPVPAGPRHHPVPPSEAEVAEEIDPEDREQH